jgi:hypothetical protein
VTDGHIVTSRKPDNVPEFTRAMMTLIENGSEAEQLAQRP